MVQAADGAEGQEEGGLIMAAHHRASRYCRTPCGCCQHGYLDVWMHDVDIPLEESWPVYETSVLDECRVCGATWETREWTEWV